MTINILMILGFLFLILSIKLERSTVLKLDIKAVSKFTLFLLLVFILRLGFYHLFDMLVDVAIKTNKIYNIINPFKLLLVGWEDCFFALPIFLSMKYLKSMKINILILIIFSLAFASGHLYQGTVVACITAFYPYISYRLGKEYGFITIMLCHTIYDLSIFATISAARYLV